jgi:aspartyl-tRNA(Asn)/glutamyl-tRNA(Gln) amidotransferase subunit B
MTFLSSIGLEVHVQLRTRSKMFCGCRNAFSHDPNIHVCPICLGYPGALPVVNAEAVRLTVRTGLMLGCRINRISKFDRKNYFYPDMPKNYQISQYDQPFGEGGGLEIETPGGPKTIGITRIHLEEDVAKSTHLAGVSLVDFNRAGAPLMEIVTEPDLDSPDEAFAFLQALKQILLYGEVSDCNLEQGNLRCDINCSVRPAGQEKLGTKIEIKNMNTFKGVHRALTFEIRRQADALSRREPLVQETRRWDDAAGATFSMRTKEYAHDYRYFPDPDLLPVALANDQVEAWRAALPEMPRQRRRRLVEQYGLPDYDAGVLVADKAVADFFEAACRNFPRPKTISNWIMTDVRRVLSEKEAEMHNLALTPEALAALARLVDEQTINMPSARELFNRLVEQGGDPDALVGELGLAQVRDAGALEALVDQAIGQNHKSVEDYRGGKTAALKFLVGQTMKLSRGKANPQAVEEILRKKLG